MESFLQEATSKTPALTFESDIGIFEISGRSIPENSIEFYKPLMDWLEDYSKTPNGSTRLQIKLEYFNTSSSKCLVEILRKLEKLHHAGVGVQIEWFYEEEDEDMQESGEDFREIIKVPFEMVVIQND